MCRQRGAAGARGNAVEARSSSPASAADGGQELSSEPPCLVALGTSKPSTIPCCSHHALAPPPTPAHTHTHTNLPTPPPQPPTPQVLEGTVPNEHGTWLYGRGGWCNGAAVPLHVVDITTALLPPSQPGGMPGSPTGLGSDAGSAGGAAGGAGADVNIISYRGEFRGASPCPQSEPGYMLMQSNLVFYFETPS